MLRDKDASHSRFLAHPMPKLVYIADQLHVLPIFKALSAEFREQVTIGEVRRSEFAVFRQYGPDALPSFLQVVENSQGRMIALLAYDFTRSNAMSFASIGFFVNLAAKEWRQIK
ncbi:hypothetical protein GUITHDRAFT_155879 [Guillardia theta CCMP2712]|uniref:Uncharacterized protein n=1 Tax=Guillardia theta (strain CCMP2712) TaxID=905079 RepID=L1ID06_GUITC|nr:hypothetical protein GUITHDRAFT_155879 [Guillardia theta CCMP2712]EKX33972.1 hypothetical protein GUITHDRAFT_155879 [Guillardia theta CCMP2712]|eukprot:XP_005820952.1 hypothetical protein GUITHDRAFT_155879 [Guillardia theta CCMP2712]